MTNVKKWSKNGQKWSKMVINSQNCLFWAFKSILGTHFAIGDL